MEVPLPLPLLPAADFLVRAAKAEKLPITSFKKSTWCNTCII
jgi:hypothetical protein